MDCEDEWIKLYDSLFGQSVPTYDPTALTQPPSQHVLECMTIRPTAHDPVHGYT